VFVVAIIGTENKSINVTAPTLLNRPAYPHSHYLHQHRDCAPCHCCSLTPASGLSCPEFSHYCVLLQEINIDNCKAHLQHCSSVLHHHTHTTTSIAHDSAYSLRTVLVFFENCACIPTTTVTTTVITIFQSSFCTLSQPPVHPHHLRRRLNTSAVHSLRFPVATAIFNTSVTNSRQIICSVLSSVKNSI
jgi:hypothetical protein